MTAAVFAIVAIGTAAAVIAVAVASVVTVGTAATCKAAATAVATAGEAVADGNFSAKSTDKKLYGRRVCAARINAV